MIQSNTKTRWWTELAWRIYGLLPAAADDVAKWRFPYVLPFKNLRIPVAILHGPTRFNGRPGTLLVAGDEYRVDYMTRQFFEGEPQQEMVGKVPLWNLALTLRRLRTSADLTIACIDRLSARSLFGTDYLAVPTWVGSMLTIPEDLTKLVKSSRNLQEDFRIVRRNNLSPEVTHAESDFEMFYHTMYVPFIHNRHGEKGVIHDVDRMRRLFRQGGLLWVIRSGQRVSGVLFRRKGQVLRSVAVGTANGEWIRGKAGTIIATYFFIIEHAKKLDCKFIDFGGSRPSLNDGVLRYKRKWGMKLIDKQNNYYDFLVHWNRFSSPVISFLSNTALIFRDQGGLSAIYVIDSDKPATQAETWKVYHSNWIPGLQRLYLISTSGWQPGVSNPPQTHLVDATTAEDCDPARLMKSKER